MRENKKIIFVNTELHIHGLAVFEQCLYHYRAEDPGDDIEKQSQVDFTLFNASIAQQPFLGNP